MIVTNPDPPVSLSNVAANTNAVQISITWSAGTFTGGTPVLDYTITWDLGVDTFT